MKKQVSKADFDKYPNQRDVAVAQQAVNAVYDFLIDVMGVQRAMGRFLFYESEADQDAWYDRLDEFVREKRKARPKLKK